MRVAIYFTPGAEHPLAEAAATWLGRDVARGAGVVQAGADGLSPAETRALTGAPRRYGFHATLKAPFRIAEPCTLAQVEQALDAFCRSRAPVPLGRLVLARIGAFFALVPTADPAGIDALAADAVRFFDRFRAAATPAEIERRHPEDLTERQRRHLQLWGYPYVFDDFRFHMTLTGSVPPARDATVEAALRRHFGAVLAAPVMLDAVSLLVEPRPGADFELRTRRALAPAPQTAIEA